MKNIDDFIFNIDIFKSFLEDYYKSSKFMPSDMDEDRFSSFFSQDSKFSWQPPRLQKIPKPTGGTRDIYIFPELDRFLQKYMNYVICTQLSSLVSPYVFSYKRHTRILEACKTVQANMANSGLWGYKLDISDYFRSVSYGSIISKTMDIFSGNPRTMNLLINLFSINECYYRDELIPQKMGIMPGCPIAAFYANLMLRELDDYCSESCQIYSRYSDDLVFFTNSKHSSEEVIKTIPQILEKYGLAVNPKKVHDLSNSQSIEFLGLIIQPDSIEVSKRIIDGVKSKIRSTCEKYYYSKHKSLPHLVHRLNHVLLSNELSVKLARTTSTIGFVLANSTHIAKIQQLDYYFIDWVNYAFTGSKRSHTKIYSTAQIEQAGFVSFVTLFNLIKTNKTAYKQKIYNILCPPKPIQWLDLATPHTPSQDLSQPRESMSFERLIANLIQGGYILEDSMRLSIKDICFDLLEDRIGVYPRTLVYSANNVHQSSFTLIDVNNQIHHIKCDRLLEDTPIFTDSTILEAYINYSCSLLDPLLSITSDTTPNINYFRELTNFDYNPVLTKSRSTYLAILNASVFLRMKHTSVSDESFFYSVKNNRCELVLIDNLFNQLKNNSKECLHDKFA